MTDAAPWQLTSYRRVLVENPKQLEEAIFVLAESDAIGVDIEMGQRMRRMPGGIQEWIHILALVQIAGNGLSVILDPLRCPVAPLASLMAGPIRKVFLGGGQDAALLQRSGIEPINIADVGEVALSLYGRREDGMAALAQRIFGISLDKTVRRADWMIRPLNPTLLAYAHQDAELTLDIYRWFQREQAVPLHAHERRYLEPGLAEDSAEWLKLLTSRNAPEADEILEQYGLERRRDEAELVAAIRAPLLEHASPRLVNKLLRAISELRLVPLLPDVLPLLSSHSSLVRVSAVRTVGKLATPDEAVHILEVLSKDPMPDVQKAVENALKDARGSSTKSNGAFEFGGIVLPETPTLDDDAISALARLRDQLQEPPTESSE